MTQTLAITLLLLRANNEILKNYGNIELLLSLATKWRLDKKTKKDDRIWLCKMTK